MQRFLTCAMIVLGIVVATFTRPRAATSVEPRGFFCDCNCAAAQLNSACWQINGQTCWCFPEYCLGGFIGGNNFPVCR